VSVAYQDLIFDHKVHSSLHVDPEVFADEMDRIFTRGWVFVGHESEIAQPGDWVTRRIGGESVIMTRDREGGVNVLANRCAHRGTALCWAAKGHATSFTCNYHAWNFALDGQLRAVPFPDGMQIDKSKLGLDRAGQVESFRGFVFANLDGSAGPLSDHLGHGGAGILNRLCDMSPTGSVDLSKGWVGHRVQSNWKLWCESDIDGSHFNFVHASMLESVDESYYGNAQKRDPEKGHGYSVGWRGGHTEGDSRGTRTRELEWIAVPRERLGGYCEAVEEAYGPERAREILTEGPPHALIFPNLFVGEMTLAIIEPVSPTEMVQRHTSVQFPGVSESFNRRMLRQADAAMGPGAFIVTDDSVTAERIQSGVNGAKPGWAGGTRGWIDMSRGLHREHEGEHGRMQAESLDEATNRGFWREYRRVMTERATT
jgi:phenylpropionate dioxygenase-like ring-hydroxylating dioxygenase large terminal subunit